MYDFAVDVCQAKTPPLILVCQTLVIDVHQVQNRGVQVMQVHFIVDRMPAEFVRGAVAHSALDASPCEPDGEPVVIVVAAFGAFVPWTPLQELRVPRIRAGGSRLVSTEVMIREDGSLVAIDGRARSAGHPYSAALRELDRDRAVLRGIRRDKQFRSMSVWQVMTRMVQEQLGEGVAVREALSDTEAADRLKLNVLNRIRSKVFFDYLEFSRSSAGVSGAFGA